MKIVFITDGGLEMGMGHIYRTISLAKEMPEQTIQFLTKSDKSIVDKIIDSGFNVIKTIDDNEIVSNLININPNVVIIDRLDIESTLTSSIKKNTQARLVLIENLNAESNQNADVVINAILGDNFGGKLENRKFVNEETPTSYFYGPKYLLLKDDFLNYKIYKPKSSSSSISSILLIFGGSDPSNLTGKVLDELTACGNDCRLDIILGKGFIYQDYINDILRRNNHDNKKIVIHKDANNVAELMYSVDLVITAPGISVFEALCVYTPVIVIHQNEWQKNGFNGFMKTLSKDDIRKLKLLIKNKEYLDPNSDYIKNFEIGKGKAEVIEAIMGGMI